MYVTVSLLLAERRCSWFDLTSYKRCYDLNCMHELLYTGREALLINVWYILQAKPSSVFLGDVIIVAVAVSIWFIILLAACIDQIFRRISLPIAISYWLVAMTSLYALAAVHTDVKPADGALMGYYVIIASYTMLPVKRVWSIVLGVATALSHIIAFGILTTGLPTDVLLHQVLACFRTAF